jgi:hypothetical protein
LEFLQVTEIINKNVKPSPVQKHTKLKTYDTLALPNLLYGCESWAIKEQYKSRITSVEIKFMRRKANHTWQEYKNNEDILLELKINPVVE